MYNNQIENRVEQPVQTATNSNVPTEPSLFTQPDVLHFINCRKWARFVSAFAPELRAANLTVPDPRPFERARHFLVRQVLRQFKLAGETPQSPAHSRNRRRPSQRGA